MTFWPMRPVVFRFKLYNVHYHYVTRWFINHIPCKILNFIIIPFFKIFLFVYCLVSYFESSDEYWLTTATELHLLARKSTATYIHISLPMLFWNKFVKQVYNRFKLKYNRFKLISVVFVWTCTSFQFVSHCFFSEAVRIKFSLILLNC